MNNQSLFFALFLSLGLLLSCDTSQKKKSDGSEFNPDEVTRLENEVKRIHDDELMPKMKDIQLMMKSLEERMQAQEAGYTEGYKKELEAAHEGLEQSYNEMMQWMEKYNPTPYKDKAQLKLYLVDERGKLWKMREGFAENISYAQSTLENPKYE